MRLPEEHRDVFRGPMGELIQEEHTGKDRISEVVAGAPYLVTVGDRTTEKMLGYGFSPDVQIVDGLERRQPRAIPPGSAETIRCTNPPAQITDEAVSAIVQAYSADRPVRILVSGEEDLLLVPALAHAPEGSVLMYGQPGEGLVVVKADATAKDRARKLLGLLERDDETVAV